MIFTRIGARQAAFSLSAAIKPRTCTVKTWGFFKVKTPCSVASTTSRDTAFAMFLAILFLLYDFDDGSKVVKSELISVVDS